MSMQIYIIMNVLNNSFSTPMNEVQGVYRNHSVCPSVQICVQPITFFWFDIGLPYLAHGFIPMRGCVAYRYIHDPDRMLIFDFKVKFTGFLTCFRVRPLTIFWCDIDLPYLANESITMRGCVAYIHDPDSTLTFDLKVKFTRSTCCPLTKSYYVWHKCVSPWHGLSHTFMTLTFDLNIKVYIFTMNLSLARSSLLFDIPVGIPNFGILVYYNETTCCVHS